MYLLTPAATTNPVGCMSTASSPLVQCNFERKRDAELSLAISQLQVTLTPSPGSKSASSKPLPYRYSVQTCRPLAKGQSSFLTSFSFYLLSSTQIHVVTTPGNTAAPTPSPGSTKWEKREPFRLQNLSTRRAASVLLNSSHVPCMSWTYPSATSRGTAVSHSGGGPTALRHHCRALNKGCNLTSAATCILQDSLHGGKLILTAYR